MSDKLFMKTLTALCMLAFAATPGIAPAQAPTKPAPRVEEPVGRLFFTPAQRASLDVARTRRARTTLNNEDEQNTPVAQTLTYGGMVRRSDGQSTMWVNNRAMSDSEAATGAVVGRVRADGSITLSLPQSGRSVDLKPGQSIELLSGVIEEGYSRKPGIPDPKPAAKGVPESAPMVEAGAAARSASQRNASDERDQEDQQRKVEEAVRTLQEAATRSGVSTVTPQPQPIPAR